MQVDPISKGTAIMCLIFNIIFVFPLGTFIHACNSKDGCLSLLVGLITIPFLLIPDAFIYAWSFSIFYGSMILRSSINAEKKREQERLINVN